MRRKNVFQCEKNLSFLFGVVPNDYTESQSISFKCSPHDDYCLIQACFIYPSWCENCHGPPHALLRNPPNTHSHIASTRERAASIIEQLFKMKEAFSTEVKCGFDRQKPFPICSAILIWSHDNKLYIIDKLQNICLPSHVQPDLFHKEKCGSLHSLSLIWNMHWKQTIELCKPYM